MKQLPFFSIIVPTYARPRQLAACLEALANLNYPRDCFELDFIQFSDAARSVEFGFISTTSELSNVSLKGRRHEIH